MSTKYEKDSYRFHVKDVEKWKAYLKEHGFVVVHGCVTEEKCKEVLQEMKKTLAAFSSELKLDDPETWKWAKNYPFQSHGGIIEYVGHAKFQWDLRELVAPIFAKIWDCNELKLATSFDGFCYMDGRRKYRKADPLSFVHSDQALLRTIYGVFRV